MARSIFDLGLSVEAVSLFLLIEGQEGSKIDPDKNCKAKPETISIDSCLTKWNGTEGDFDAALEELSSIGAVQNKDSVLSITKPETWKTK